MRKTVLGALAAAICAVTLGACGSSGSSSSTSDVTAFCDKVNAVKSLDNPFANVQPTDIQGAKDALAKFQSELSDIAAVTPAEIKPEMDQAKSTIDAFAGKISKASTPAELAAAAQSFQGQALKLQAGNAKIHAYVSRHCK
jgi:hypothetical protein